MPAATRPVGGVDYPRTYQEFNAWFPDDAACREYLAQLRWPDGWTVGTLHYRVSRQHLPYYLDEFTSRFNRRTSRARGMLLYRLLQQAVDTDPHPLKELIGG